MQVQAEQNNWSFLGNLRAGDAFLYHGNVYMVIKFNNTNRGFIPISNCMHVTRLSDGLSITLTRSAKVRPVNAYVSYTT